MMSPPSLDLLVVEHRTPRELTRLLESIDPAGHATAVWIGLVDTTPESRTIANDWAAASPLTAHVTEWADNVGYNRAINRLGTLGEHEVIACLNADTVLNPTALSELAWATWAHPDWGVVGPRQIDRHGRISAGGIFGTVDKPRHRGWRAVHGYNDVRDDAIYVAGSALFLRREVWDDLTACGLYRAMTMEPGPWGDTQHYYGDSYLSLHARAHDLKAVYYGITTIRHDVGGTRVSTRDRPDRERFRAVCDAHHMPHE